MKSCRSFETERLLLRPTSEEDAPLLLELLNTPKWLKFIGDRNVKSLEDAERYVRDRIHPQLERLGFSNYSIILKSDGTKVGICGLYDREGLEGIDLGFALLPNFEGFGYALEAAREIRRAAVMDFNISKLKAITTKYNLASQRLLKSLGFWLVGPVHVGVEDDELLLYEWHEQETER